MSFIKPILKHQKTAADVVLTLAHNGVYCKCIPQNGSFVLVHNKTKEEFHQLMIDICEFLGLKAQDERWFPGSPSNEYDSDNNDDYGYYVYPIKVVNDNEENPTNFDYDFDMMISTQEVSWC